MSTRGNHLLGAANDYRAVDIPGLVGDPIGDARIGVFKSIDAASAGRARCSPDSRTTAARRA
jgi:hypothetical protein